MNKEELFNDFDKVSDETWLEKIEADLKGKSASEIAKNRKYEGFDLKVFYAQSDKTEEQSINAHKGWRISSVEDFIENTIADPIYNLVSTGNWLYDDSRDLSLYIKIFNEEIKEKNLGVDGSLYQNAGASAHFELACILSHLNDYLHDLKKHRVLKSDFLNKLSIKVSVSSDYFLEITKLRALRILVDNLAKAYDLDSIPFELYVENSTLNYSSADADTNILRNTTAGMSAILGSCDHLIIYAHDKMIKEWHQFGDRIAKNIQLLMKHEGHLDKVNDPGSGSYYIEWLTKTLAEKAWVSFKEIEKNGGFIESFMKGHIQQEIKKTADMRMEDVSSGSYTLIGINKYKREGSSVSRRALEWDKGEYVALKPLFLEDATH